MRNTEFENRNVASFYVTQRLEHAQFHKCTLRKGGKYASDIDPSSIVHKVFSVIKRYIGA
jgi:hypothetical protein